MNDLVARTRRVARRQLDRLRWGGEIRTVLRGPARGLRIGARHSSANYAEGANELPVQDALQRLLRPGNTFLDIGANVGFFSLLAARLVGPAGRVVAFEAVPAIAQAIVANAQLNEFANIDVRPVAVGHRSGRALVRLTRHPGGATVAGDADVRDVTSTFEVDMVSIDSLVAAGELPVPDVIKIDVEGNERDTLLGMGELLRSRRPTLVVEIDAATGDGLTRKRIGIEEILLRSGYSIQALPPSYTGAEWHVVHLVATAG